MKFERTEVFNFEGAIHGMRNPKNSWARSDSKMGFSEKYHKDMYLLGPNDLFLCKTLIHGGPEHRKFLRQLFITVDITAPLYFWSEFDTYKVGTVANSTSFMHKGVSKPFDISMFECDDPTDEYFLSVIQRMNVLREAYLSETNEEEKQKIWRKILQIRPSSWLQTRTVTLNYEVAYHMYTQREFHKLVEWRIYFCNWVVKWIPYFEEFFLEDKRTKISLD